MSKFIPFKLPSNLELGCATAATQIEGGDKNNSWYDWASKEGRIKGGGSPLRGNNHWELYEQDIKLMADMGINHYRFGIEWSRIEPEKGVFDEKAMEHYVKEIKLMLSSNIHPLVTLHHFTNPMWFEKIGAFETEASIPLFKEFVIYVTEHLKELCTDYVTINEPNVYATNGYVYGTWPPGEKSIIKAMKVMKNLTLCHITAYKEIHRIYGDKKVMVGFANHLRVFEGCSNNPIYKLEAKIMGYLFQGAITKSMASGRLAFPLGAGAPLGIGKFYDYIGINYYTRSSIKHFAEHVLKDREINNLGWDIYPEGLTMLCREQYEKYKAPIWITENGTCDKDDSFRPRYIYDHIKQIADSGLPIERYYHWTLMDNFEWAEGETAPFGLVKCDFETQKRTIRSSGKFYMEMIKTRQVSSDMISYYLKTGE
jgi:beta-glucosidase